jgi:hypothetical protein
MEPSAVVRMNACPLDEVDIIEAMLWWHGVESVAIVDDERAAQCWSSPRY